MSNTLRKISVSVCLVVLLIGVVPTRAFADEACTVALAGCQELVGNFLFFCLNQAELHYWDCVNICVILDPDPYTCVAIVCDPGRAADEFFCFLEYSALEDYCLYAYYTCEGT